MTFGLIRVVALFCLMATAMFFNPSPASAPVLQGGVKETAQSNLASRAYPENAFEGLVVSAENGQALGEVRISIPAIGYQAYTGSDGRFELPPLPQTPVIVAFERRGYVPKSLTLNSARLAQAPKRVVLHQSRNTLVLDTEIRHLGDNSYSPASSGANRFRQGNTEGPVLRRQFSLQHLPISALSSNPAVLEIGSVIGLDTVAAHQQGQSRFHRASTPMQIRLNGQVIGLVETNGDALRFPVHPDLLNYQGVNTLEIATGVKISNENTPDYDDMELMLLTLKL